MKTTRLERKGTYAIFKNATLSKLEQKDVKGGVIVVDIIAPL